MERLFENNKKKEVDKKELDPSLEDDLEIIDLSKMAEGRSGGGQQGKTTVNTLIEELDWYT